MQHERKIAIQAAREAGALIAEIYHRQDFSVQEKSNDRGPLTEADLAANQRICTILREAFPHDAILSEEEADNKARLSNRRCWIIDPLDGTREFTLGIPEFAVSIGLVIDNEAVLGVVYNPITDECICGIVGEGTTLNGETVQCSRHDAIDGGRFLVSRSEHKKGWFKPWEALADLQPMGSVAYKLALVAVGKADATFTPKPRNAWDLCGGVACILAAGGRTTNGSGQHYQFNEDDPLKIGVCGTNGVIHDAVLALMEQAGS